MNASFFPQKRALVLFSGGQDSTTCLAWALSRYGYVETVAFDYGQRHQIELQMRLQVINEIRKLFSVWSSRLQQDHVLTLEALPQIGDSALTTTRQIEIDRNGLPNTYVPGRNLLFLTLASALGYRRQLDILVGGMCETDFSGYPDCRDNAIKAQQVAISLGLGSSFTIETPLMWCDKAQVWAMAEHLGASALVETIVEYTHTCYLGERGMRHDWGYGCNQCPACVLRRGGWENWCSERVSQDRNA